HPPYSIFIGEVDILQCIPTNSMGIPEIDKLPYLTQTYPYERCKIVHRRTQQTLMGFFQLQITAQIDQSIEISAMPGQIPPLRKPKPSITPMPELCRIPPQRKCHHTAYGYVLGSTKTVN